MEREKLAAPGSGISGFEMLLLNRVIKPIVIRNSGKPKALAHLQRSAGRVEALVERIDEKSLTKRILVPRPWFVEDSSRDWSAAMLCRHLEIVDTALARAIEKGLTPKAEQLPGASQRVAAVKPESERNDLLTIRDFRDAVSSLVAAAEKHGESDLAHRVIPHPWLGELSHLQWLWFAAFHHDIHLRHLKKIVSELKLSDRR